MTTIDMGPATSTNGWLKRYYAVRAIFSIIWVALAFTVGAKSPALAITLLLIYPAWDCLANFSDARRNGGLGANPTQAINVFVSAAVTAAVAFAATRGFEAVAGVIGVWAVLSGLLQLATGVRRWRSAGAQWPMILSGAQSSLAGLFFIKQAADATMPLGIVTIAPYAAFGAIYFAIAAIALSTRREAARLA